MDLPGYFSKNIHKYVSRGDSIVIALSGGPDSVALLHLLYSIRDEYKLKLYAAHFNHMLRGRASFNDAVFAEKLCVSKSIPFFLGKKDIRKISSERKGGVEKTARIERYKFLMKCAAKVNAGKIAAGHNLDDNAETVLMKLISGAGSEGLSGIADKRVIYPGEFNFSMPHAQRSSFTLIRPLSGAHKNEILGFLKARRIKYAVDKTNGKNVYTRNRLRNRLIPMIAKEFNPRVKDALASAGNILSAENDYMDKAALSARAAVIIHGKNGAQMDLKKLFKYHEALRRRVVRQVLKDVFKSPRKVDFDAVESVLECAAGHKPLQLPEGFFCSVKNNILAISRKIPNTPYKPVIIGSCKSPDAVFNGFKFSFKTTKNIDGMDFSGRDTAFIDLDSVRFPLAIRLRKPGDKFIPYGMDGEVRMKKFFNTCGLEPGSPVISDTEKIIWAAGGRIDNRVRVKHSTRCVLIIEKSRAGQ